MAENAARHLGQGYDALAKSVERLSSGLRINSAKDDAAGLAVRELIRADVATLQQGSRNARDAISMLQTAEGALGAIDDILVRMKELAEQASTGSYSAEQYGLMNDEFAALSAEIDRIVNNTAFNEIKLLNDASSNYDIHIGTSETITISSKDLRTDGDLALGSRANLVGLGVDSTGAAYVEGDGADNLTFQFQVDINGDGDQTDANEDYTITLTPPAAGGWTLQETVDAINAESRKLMGGWNAASAVRDAETGQYHLKLEGICWKSSRFFPISS
jgi:flagellin